MTPYEGADAPLTADARAQRRAGFGTASRGVAPHHDVPHTTNPGSDSVETLRAEKNDRQIRLRSVGEAIRWLMLGDVLQLQQPFLNLCLNTIQAMDPAGEMTVRVADLFEGSGSTLPVEAADSGSTPQLARNSVESNKQR